MDYKLVVNRLEKDELTYELAFRGITNVTIVSEMRKTLRNLLKLERQVDDSSKMHYPTYPFSFTEDVSYVKAKMTELDGLIKGFADSDKCPIYEKITTKLVHVFQRASRAVATTDEEFVERQRTVLSIMNLQSDLKSRLKKYKKLSQSSQVPLDLSILMSSTGVASSSESESSSGESVPDVPFTSTHTHANVNSMGACSHKSSSVPVYKWNVAKFDGNKSSISLCAFLEQVEELRVSRNVSYDQLFRSAGDLFSGKAKVWYNGMRNHVHSWEELVKELRLQYLGTDSLYNKELLKEIKQRSQHPDESIGIYIACMNTLFNRLTVPVSDKARLDILLENLAPYYKRELGMKDIQSVDQLLQLGRRAEANKKAIDSYIPPPRHRNFLEPDLAYVYSEDVSSSPSTPSTSTAHAVSTNNIVCWNCKTPGHAARNCSNPIKNRHCFKCGNANYTVRTCPKCNAGNPPGRH